MVRRLCTRPDHFTFHHRFIIMPPPSHVAQLRAVLSALITWRTTAAFRALAWTILLATGYWLLLPRPLFDVPVCLVLEDRAGNLLGARIANDEQWRFPTLDTVPKKFAQALIAFEDQRFYAHPGVDPVALVRAMGQFVRQGRIVSGGSTISMQTIRLARQRKTRNLWQKAVEMLLATRLEQSYSKSDILALYASHAPFGGNVVGLDAASWRYFGKRPDLLSWAEAATLAVLPNSPALIHPGRNRQQLLDKRNRLLDRLQTRGLIDAAACALAKAEPLPEAPHPLPRLAPHLLDQAYAVFVKTRKVQQSRIRTTLDATWQQQTTQLVQRHQQMLRYNEIHNAAAIVIDIETGEVLAYVGNAPGAGETRGEEVDIIKAPRSTGSLLKPLLYACALQEGLILPNSLLSDVPTQLSGYRPENYLRKYDGMVPARRALSRSLNVPFVQLLQQYGLEKFHFNLQKLGLTTIKRPAAHYGLPLILGGAEGNLWELTGLYASMARTLNHYATYVGKYDPNDFRPPHYLYEQPVHNAKPTKRIAEAPWLSAAAIRMTFDAMQEVERPNSEGNWQHFRSERRIAWKTGTSIGFRDAWAIGVDARYAVGVWVGNADGEGRPGLVGVLTAAPLLFDIFKRLPAGGWFEIPYPEMIQAPVCRLSGYRALPTCTPTDTIWIPAAGLRAPGCPFHQIVHLDTSGRWQVSADCEAPHRIRHESWFVLPPLEEHYFKAKNPTYKPLPLFRKDCQQTAGHAASIMQLIYPRRPTRIYVPVDLNGQLSRTVFTIAHRNPETAIYWHLDDTFIGSTHTFHSMELNPPEGSHLLTLVDEQGNRLEQHFEIITRPR